MNTNLSPWISIVLWFTIGGIEFAYDANAAEPKSDDVTKVESQMSAELATAEVALWKFRLTKEPTRELTLVTTPILRWTNPVVGRVYGTVYVVTDDGRPQAIVSPYKWFTPYTGMDIECRSLASTDIEGIRDQKSVWSTSKPGVEWKPVPGDPAVGKTAAERQRQMKQLAREFTAELLDTQSIVGQDVRRILQCDVRLGTPSLARGVDPEVLQRRDPRAHHPLVRQEAVDICLTDPVTRRHRSSAR